MIKIDVTVHLHAGGVDEVLRMLAHIKSIGENTMTAIADFAAKQNAFNARMDAAVQGLTGDVAELNRKIAELQQSPGTITPEDQALLDDLEQRGEAISQKLEALDQLNPPAPPIG